MRGGGIHSVRPAYASPGGTLVVAQPVGPSCTRARQCGFGELQCVVDGEEATGGCGGHPAGCLPELVEGHGDDRRDRHTPMPTEDPGFENHPEHRAEGVVVPLRSGAGVPRCGGCHGVTIDRRVLGVAAW